MGARRLCLAVDLEVLCVHSATPPPGSQGPAEPGPAPSFSFAACPASRGVPTSQAPPPPHAPRPSAHPPPHPPSQSQSQGPEAAEVGPTYHAWLRPGARRFLLAVHPHVDTALLVRHNCPGGAAGGAAGGSIGQRTGGGVAIDGPVAPSCYSSCCCSCSCGSGPSAAGGSACLHALLPAALRSLDPDGQFFGRRIVRASRPEPQASTQLCSSGSRPAIQIVARTDGGVAAGFAGPGAGADACTDPTLRVSDLNPQPSEGLQELSDLAVQELPDLAASLQERPGTAARLALVTTADRGVFGDLAEHAIVCQPYRLEYGMYDDMLDCLASLVVGFLVGQEPPPAALRRLGLLHSRLQPSPVMQALQAQAMLRNAAARRQAHGPAAPLPPKRATALLTAETTYSSSSPRAQQALQEQEQQPRQPRQQERGRQVCRLEQGGTSPAPASVSALLRLPVQMQLPAPVAGERRSAPDSSTVSSTSTTGAGVGGGGGGGRSGGGGGGGRSATASGLCQPGGDLRLALHQQLRSLPLALPSPQPRPPPPSSPSSQQQQPQQQHWPQWPHSPRSGLASPDEGLSDGHGAGASAGAGAGGHWERASPQPPGRLGGRRRTSASSLSLTLLTHLPSIPELPLLEAREPAGPGEEPDGALQGTASAPLPTPCSPMSPSPWLAGPGRGSAAAAAAAALWGRRTAWDRLTLSLGDVEVPASPAPPLAAAPQDARSTAAGAARYSVGEATSPGGTVDAAPAAVITTTTTPAAAAAAAAAATASEGAAAAATARRASPSSSWARLRGSDVAWRPRSFPSAAQPPVTRAISEPGYLAGRPDGRGSGGSRSSGGAGSYNTPLGTPVRMGHGQGLRLGLVEEAPAAPLPLAAAASVVAAAASRLVTRLLGSRQRRRCKPVRASSPDLMTTRSSTGTCASSSCASRSSASGRATSGRPTSASASGSSVRASSGGVSSVAAGGGGGGGAEEAGGGEEGWAEALALERLHAAGAASARRRSLRQTLLRPRDAAAAAAPAAEGQGSASSPEGAPLEAAQCLPLAMWVRRLRRPALSARQRSGGLQPAPAPAPLPADPAPPCHSSSGVGGPGLSADGAAVAAAAVCSGGGSGRCRNVEQLEHGFLVVGVDHSQCGIGLVGAVRAGAAPSGLTRA